MKKTAVILGATGKVGGKVSEILLKEGRRVKLIARTPETLNKYRDMGAEVIAADIANVNALTNAFKNADSVFVLLPPYLKAISYRQYQRKIGDAIIQAIEQSGIQYVINLSSCGAHMHEGNGIIAGLAEQEVKLNQLESVNVLHLRPAYFMENSLSNIGLIKGTGINGSTADGDHKIPMTATKDIAVVAAKHIANQDFSGKIVQAVLGDSNYSFKEFTEILGNSIGKPGLRYIQFPPEQAKQAMMSHGISEDVAKDIIGMETSLAEGVMNYERRNDKNTTPTSAEEFAQEVFLPTYTKFL